MSCSFYPSSNLERILKNLWGNFPARFFFSRITKNLWGKVAGKFLNCTEVPGKCVFSGHFPAGIFPHKFFHFFCTNLTENERIWEDYERILQELWKNLAGIFLKVFKKKFFFFLPPLFLSLSLHFIFFFYYYYFFLEDFVRKFSVEILPTRTHDRWNQSPELNRWATAIWNYINYVWRKDIFKLLISFAIIFMIVLTLITLYSSGVASGGSKGFRGTK